MDRAFDTAIELTGPWRRPRQMLADQTYGDHHSIHDDATAQQVGFSAATIEGPTHFSQFDPLFVAVWGDRWFESGGLSAHFLNAAHEGDEVRATIALPHPGARHATISAAKADGTPVLAGTATIDPDELDTEVERRLARVRAPEQPRIVDQIAVGDRTPPERVCIGPAETLSPLYPFSLSEKLAVITEPSPWYGEESGRRSPWGRAMLPTEMLSVLTLYTAVEAFPVRQPAVGLFVDLEVRRFGGPVFVGEEYVLEREVVALGESRRTESYWVRSTVSDLASGEAVASTLLHNAFFKESHPG